MFLRHVNSDLWSWRKHCNAVIVLHFVPSVSIQPASLLKVGTEEIGQRSRGLEFPPTRPPDSITIQSRCRNWRIKIKLIRKVNTFHTHIQRDKKCLQWQKTHVGPYLGDARQKRVDWSVRVGGQLPPKVTRDLVPGNKSTGWVTVGQHSLIWFCSFAGWVQRSCIPWIHPWRVVWSEVMKAPLSCRSSTKSRNNHNAQNRLMVTEETLKARVGVRDISPQRIHQQRNTGCEPKDPERLQPASSH